jgi:phospholipid/cholesterol/gamma-HCH transport system ATP-binding protein
MNKETSARKYLNTSVSTDAPVIEMKGIRKSYNNCGVLKDLNLTIRKGENLVVLGKSGSGKSVLIKCIVGLVTPDEGEVYVFGKNITELNYRQLNEMRLKIGFLFQNAALYDSMTVGENLYFPLKHHFKHLTEMEIEKRIYDELDNVGLKESIDKSPSELSGGMTKRIGLARTLILKPEIMLYDEPTTGLDTATAMEISDLIVSMQKKNKTTSIIITHDMACAKITADRIVILKDGMIETEGTYDELAVSDNEWVRTFFA